MWFCEQCHYEIGHYTVNTTSYSSNSGHIAAVKTNYAIQDHHCSHCGGNYNEEIAVYFVLDCRSAPNWTSGQH